MAINQIIQKIIKDKVKLRANNLAIAEANFEEIMKVPEFKKLEFAKKTLAFDMAKNQLHNIDISNSKSEYKNIELKQDEILAKYNLTREDLKPKFDCKICNDTGRVNGEICKCVKEQYTKILRESCNFTAQNKFTFKDFNENIYKNETEKNNAKNLYKACYKYCKVFPNTRTNTLLLIGETGVGKTCLISAMSNKLIDQGNLVCYLTAFELNNIFLKYHLADINKKDMMLDSVLNSDILIIDDLGTEPIYKNVTLEYLFLIINQRVLENKHTIISTNLDLLDILDRYGERIFSRLTDKRKSVVKKIVSSDLRLN